MTFYFVRNESTGIVYKALLDPCTGRYILYERVYGGTSWGRPVSMSAYEYDDFVHGFPNRTQWISHVSGGIPIVTRRDWVDVWGRRWARINNLPSRAIENPLQRHRFTMDMQYANWFWITV